MCLQRGQSSGFWESFYDGFIGGRWGLRGVADAEVVVRPVEFRSTQAVGGASHKGCGGICGSEGDQLTVRLHGQGRTLQKRVEGGCTEA